MLSDPMNDDRSCINMPVLLTTFVLTMVWALGCTEIWSN